MVETDTDIFLSSINRSLSHHVSIVKITKAIVHQYETSTLYSNNAITMSGMGESEP
jgi:hypothetical protein